MRYIDLTSGKHNAEEHWREVRKLQEDGFRFTHSTYGNPNFYNEKTKESVCILASIVDGSVYFTP